MWISRKEALLFEKRSKNFYSFVVMENLLAAIGVKKGELIAALQLAQAGHGNKAFDELLYERLDATLTEYVSALQQALPAPPR